MQVSNVMCAALIAMGLYGASALAAGSGVDLETKVLNQKVAVKIAAGNPAVTAVQAQGPVNAGLTLQGQSSGNCLLLVEQIAPGVCVPTGPGSPVSPN